MEFFLFYPSIQNVPPWFMLYDLLPCSRHKSIIINVSGRFIGTYYKRAVHFEVVLSKKEVTSEPLN